MIAIESRQRRPLSQREIWSFMAGMYAVVGIALGCEGALTNLVGALTDESMTPAGRRLERS